MANERRQAANPTRRGIVFGALAPKLHEQVGASRRRMRYLQDCADGIVALAVGGLLSDGEIHRARKRLMKRIAEVTSSPAPSVPRGPKRRCPMRVGDMYCTKHVGHAGACHG